MEIKFRGKRIDNGEWAVGFLEFHLVDGDLTKTKQDAFITYDYMDKIGKVYRDRFEVIPKTVGQFTGIKDRNGTDIYENDIITSSRIEIDKMYFVGTPDQCATQKKVPELHCVKWKESGYSGARFTFGRSGIIPATFSMEVVGNSFENPELLAIEKVKCVGDKCPQYYKTQCMQTRKSVVEGDSCVVANVRKVENK